MSLPSYSSAESDISEALPQSLPLGHDLDDTAVPDSEAVEACFDWLSFHRMWGTLGDDALGAIAQALRPLSVEPGTPIYGQGQTAIGLYLLKWGSVEIYRQSPVGRMHICYRSAGDLFGYVPLVAESMETTYQASAIALTACDIWILPQPNVKYLTHTYPEIQAPINRLLARDLSRFAQRIAWEKTRSQGLQRYSYPIPVDEPLLGSSKAAQKIAQQVSIAANDVKPIVFQAGTGSGKTFLAGMIHSRSGVSRHPFAELDCAQLPKDEAGVVQSDALFGRDDGMVGVIELLERGTLLIDNVHMLTEGDRDRLCTYLKTGIFTRNPAPSTLTAPNSPTPVTVWVRLVLTSPQKLSLPNIEAHVIKLFTSYQRKDDIPEFARYFLQKFCREQGREALQLDQSDLRRLISYAYPGNFGELAGILKRAVVMTPSEQTIIPEQVLWSVQSAKNAFRVDLLDHIPWLRRFLLSTWWPERFWMLMMAMFIPVTALGFVGPQTRDASMTLNFFWAWWWPGYLLLFGFVGRIWCSVCPFMITGEWIRKLSLWIWPRDLLPWPTKWMNRWGAWFLFAGFVAIYLWEHLWDLPHTPYLSSWLLVMITAGAVMGSLIYERRLWCRYLCPIGGMNGMFAKLSMVEVRSTQQVCGSQCSTFGCYRGSAATPVTFANALPTEGQATGGCPLYSHPAQLRDNRDCVLCMTCLKACPHRSVQINLRFPASDLLNDHQGFWAEAALMLLLLGGVFMHHDRLILSWVGLSQLPVDADHLLIGMPIVAIFLSIPAGLTYGVHAIARLLDRQMPNYLTVVYAYLPLTLAANLAHYLPAAITEAGKILPVIARTLGFSGQGLPTLTWSPDVAAFLQGVVLLSGIAFSIYPLLRITKRSLLGNAPHLLLMVSLVILYFQLMVYSTPP